MPIWCEMLPVPTDHEAPQNTWVASLLQYTADAIMVVNPSGDLRYVSPASELLFAGVSGPDAVNSIFHLVHQADEDHLRTALTRTAAGHRFEGPIEWRTRSGDGGWRNIESTVVSALNDPAVLGLVITSHDVTERTLAAALMHHRAFHDPLTGLPNRALLLDRLDQALHRAQRSGRFVALLYLDLDRFKVINDSLGHIAGDQVLVEVADRLASTVRPGDTVARLGGDEFVVLAEAVTGHAEAEQIAERLRASLVDPVALRHGGTAVVTTSIGITLSRQPHPDSALRDADTALYRAKEQGRDRHHIFDEGLRHQAVRRLGTEQLLRRALDTSDFVLHYQPIIELETGRVTSNEALLRID